MAFSDLIKNFKALDVEAFKQLLNYLGYTEGACYRLDTQNLTFIFGTSPSKRESWPSIIKYDYKYYTSNSSFGLPLGWTSPKLHKKSTNNWPNRTIPYFPEQELLNTKLVLFLVPKFFTKVKTGHLDGYLEAILKRISFWIDKGELKHFITDITQNEHLKQVNLDTQKLISHDLRTYISVISGFTHLLEEQYKTNSNIKEFSSIVNDASSKALNAVERIDLALTYAHDSFTPNQTVEKVNIIDLINNAEEMISQRSSEAENKLELEVKLSDENDTNLIKGNPKSLNRAFFEVLDNAFRHSKENRVLVFVKKSEQNIIVEIEDDGEGIPKGNEDLIFLKFFQGPEINEERGMGIGLYLAKKNN
jgi:K+-sensing histidine kinase KdpD